jgi:leader peptidase (prepilin peptidase)/N-methyltransferase
LQIVTTLASTPALLLPAAFVFGLIVGSFLNVVIHRLPVMMENDWRGMCDELFGPGESTQQAEFNLVRPRSRCPHCDHTISAIENIPVISYLFLKARCRGCGARISLRYPLVELLTATMSLTAVWLLGFTAAALGALLFSWALIALSFIDFDKQLLPDSITLALLWLGLGFNVFGVYTDLQSAVIGAMAGYLALWSVYWLFKLLTGKEGMGFGDFKLLAALGAWLGWQMLPVIVITSSLVGALSGSVYLALRGHDHGTPVPFGPFLALAGWIALFWGRDLSEAYLRWVGL